MTLKNTKFYAMMDDYIPDITFNVLIESTGKEKRETTKKKRMSDGNKLHWNSSSSSSLSREESDDAAVCGRMT